MSFEIFESTSAELAEIISAILQRSISHAGTADFVACGGKSALNIYHSLSNKNLPWKNVRVTLTDDRSVPATHPDSNVNTIFKNLMVRKAAVAKFIPMQDLKLRDQRAFDLVLLGMGEDGHIASLFPDMSFNSLAFNPFASPEIISTAPHGNPQIPRFTMNFSMLTNCKTLILLANTAKKKNLIKELRKNRPTLSKVSPVSLLLKQNKTPVLVYFVV